MVKCKWKPLSPIFESVPNLTTISVELKRTALILVDPLRTKVSSPRRKVLPDRRTTSWPGSVEKYLISTIVAGSSPGEGMSHLQYRFSG